MAMTRYVAAAIFSAGACITLAAQTGSALSTESAPEFMAWAGAHLSPLSNVQSSGSWSDLEPLGEMIDDATVVALSEGVHCGAEPLEFRNRLLQYLVEKKGFTAIAIESGIVESRVVHDYVRGGEGDLQAVLARGISWTFDSLPQNRTLVQWLRDYNADPKHARKVNFYGFDVPGSPANPNAKRSHETALGEALRYLSKADPEKAKGFRSRFDPFVGRLQFNWHDAGNGLGYLSLSQIERDSLTAGISDLLSLLERKEAQYISATSSTDYAWGHRAALGARQMDQFLRNVPMAWKPVGRLEQSQPTALQAVVDTGNTRDRAQADNLQWILEQEGSSGKVLIFVHLSHLTATPGRWPPVAEKFYVSGTYLKRRLGQRLVTLGNLIGSAHMRCGTDTEKLEPAHEGSIESALAELKVPRFLLDLRPAPAPVKAWLNQDRLPAHGPGGFKMRPADDFDILLYLDTVSPAVSAEPAPAR